MKTVETLFETWNDCQTLPENLQADMRALAEDADKKYDAFYQPLEFGTAGMRGILGAGINRMNIYTVRQATEGLSQLILEKGEAAKERGVVIAYDSRHQSPEFALETARVLAHHGIKAYVFESLRPTPTLSFAVRELNCIAGVMITASHNPAAYNGYKIYGEDGGQMPPQDADAVTRFVRAVENPLELEVADEQHELIEIVGEKLDARYLEEMSRVTINHELVASVGKDLKLVYTPLHGTGKMLGERALKQAGFDSFVIVPEQAEGDPDFSTVKSPNPEEYSAFEYAIRLGKEEEADLLLATDPDADRLGAAVRMPDGEYTILTGNQIAAIMLHYILTAHRDAQTLPQNGVALKSIVSSEMATAIAKDFDIEMVDVLTGFKFIAEKIKEYEATGEKTFLFGFEESYGYLIQDFARDKDAIQALVLLAEIAAYYKAENKTMYDALQELFETYGYFIEETISVTMDGAEGSEKIKALMRDTRAEGIQSFGGKKVVVTQDFQSQKATTNEGQVSDITLPQANVLKYLLEDGSWVAIRPSGTEPKIKFYIGVQGEERDVAQAKLDDIKADIQRLVEKH
ncbi:phosphoglucomutase/phosphomannomutase [Vagococcus lutrae LBD1]|uniref:Phosphoglucomutase n=1 Tax=Vagococcus lutrae LBD1 TaxID=1408226 RepID=V6Q672_9ENTE|nr:phospho-sugar mutase [Vagococcus lutrae]EST90272.1 phosphoglucomutase/phosphomannomutase [Vagococcus lutrae LBD1]